MSEQVLTILDWTGSNQMEVLGIEGSGYSLIYTTIFLVAKESILCSDFSLNKL